MESKVFVVVLDPDGEYGPPEVYGTYPTEREACRAAMSMGWGSDDFEVVPLLAPSVLAASNPMCRDCKRSDVPLHTNGLCGNCHTPA